MEAENENAADTWVYGRMAIQILLGFTVHRK